MNKQELRKAGKLKKAIIFDCDNTLWKGILGEEEITPDNEIQNDIVFLANHGVIIGLCSKNNEGDVMNALKTQILTEEYISVKRINWKDKASNLKEIAEELNIGTDAIMFVDDSCFEIGMLESAVPEILCIYPYELIEKAHEWFDLTGTFGKTKEYKEQYQRVKAKEQFTDINEYLKSLGMVLTIKCNEPAYIERIAELSQKTNQFNLALKRYLVADIASLIDNVDVYTLSVKDKFGDSGVTGVAIVFGSRIDTFLLSCRILGRGIEYAFMDRIIDDMRKSGADVVYGAYVKSAKNEQVEYFYTKIGFEWNHKSGEHQIYSIDIHDYKPQAKNHFTYE